MSLEDVTLKVTVTVPPGSIVVGVTKILFAFGAVGADVQPVTVSASLVCTNPPDRPLASKGTRCQRHEHILPSFTDISLKMSGNPYSLKVAKGK